MKAIGRYYNKSNLRVKQLVDNVEANADAMGEQSANAKQAADATYRDYLAALAKPGQVPFTEREEQEWNRRLGSRSIKS
jgi:hypothetical protein